MKTIRQIADEIGVSKQSIQKRIAREPLCTRIQTYISTNNGTKYIDEIGETLIKSAFSRKEEPSVHIDGSDNQLVEFSILVSMLQGELEIKNEQIRELNNRLAESNAALVAAQQTAQAAQMLHAGTIKKQLTDGEPSDGDVKKKGFFGLFRK